MSTPFDWRLDDIERKANAAAPRFELDALRGDVARLERSLGEVCAERDGLRSAIESLQARIEALEALVTS